MTMWPLENGWTDQSKPKPQEAAARAAQKKISAVEEAGTRNAPRR